MSTLAEAQSYKTPQVISLLLLHKFSNFTQKKKKIKPPSKQKGKKM